MTLDERKIHGVADGEVATHFYTEWVDVCFWNQGSASRQNETERVGLLAPAGCLDWQRHQARVLQVGHVFVIHDFVKTPAAKVLVVDQTLLKRQRPWVYRRITFHATLHSCIHRRHAGLPGIQI
jgi:hypothetical protein